MAPAARTLIASMVLASAGISCKSDPPEAAPALDVAVLVDGRAPQTPREDLERVVAKASRKLEELAGVRLNPNEFVYGYARKDFYARAEEAVTQYVSDHAANPPPAVIIFSNDSQAHLHGGYNRFLPMPEPFENPWPSPNPEIGNGNYYVAVVEYDHIYARCGYDADLRHVSDVSIGGECWNEPGTPCVARADGKWVCSSSLQYPYADPDEFVSCDIVHEIAHSFGYPNSPDGGADHYGTPACIARTGMSEDDAANGARAEHYCVICPDVFDRIRAVHPATH